MNDKIVTFEDLPALREVLASVASEDGEGSAEYELVQRLIAAAEADQPPLPEGWVTETHPDGTSRIVWHKDGVTSMWSSGQYETITGPGTRLTPLRPTVTEADVEKAAEALRADFHSYADELIGWSRADPGVKRDWIKNARAALQAIGIEVSPC